jgi:serine phosphatase RsbU (regulator of sigma subunit)
MKRAAAAACAVAGLLSLWHLMPKLDAALGGVRPTVGREEAIRRAILWGREHGVEIGGWRFAAAAEVDPLLARIRHRRPESVVARVFTPVKIRVLAFNDPGDAVQVVMTAEGRPLAFLDRRQSVAGETADDAAERELARLAGADAARFTRTAENVRTLEGSRSAWEWLDPELNGVLARVVVVTRNGRVVNSSYEFSASRGAAGQPPPAPANVQAALAVLTALCAGLIAVLMFRVLFVSLQKRPDAFGFAGRFLWIPAAGMAAAFLSGNYQNDALLQSFEDGLTGETRLVFGISMALLILLAVFLILSAAYAAAPRPHFRRWAAAVWLTRGRWRTRQAAEQIWTGMAAGALLGSVPYWVGLAAGEPRVRFLEGTNLLMAPWPAAEAFAGLVLAWEMYAIVLFFFPLLAGRLRKDWSAAIGAIAVGALVATLPRPAFPPGHAANFASAAALTAGYLLTYRFGGMLGAWMAPLGMHAAVQGVRLAQMPAPSLEAAGWQVLALVFGLAVAALGASFLFPEADTKLVEAEMEEAAAAPPRPQRERLRAELEVARRAQEELLPAQAPRIEGFETAALCQPAREVGGDLYDLLACPGERWMLCVADVSGKGLGAALHMTMLKGMLVSAAHHAPAPAALASRLNQAVAETGRGRMFITMSLLLLDPVRRAAEHLRAGHNPPLVWRAQTGECEWRKPRGIGLGLTAGPAFEANLETERIEFAPGDVLVMYSDGVTEDMNSGGEPFGEERLERIVRRHAAEGPGRLADAIMEEARAFRGGAELHDDWTLLVVQCRDGAQAPGNNGKSRGSRDAELSD